MAVLGIDIGGSGIKGAPVDTRRGRVLADRYRVKTPRPATPDAVVESVVQVASHFDRTGPVGVTFPGVVQDGVVRTAANMHKSWLGVDFAALLTERLGAPACVLNDADAAAFA